METKRKYNKRTKEERQASIAARLTRLKLTHAVRAGLIAELEAKHEKITGELIDG